MRLRPSPLQNSLALENLSLEESARFRENVLVVLLSVAENAQSVMSTVVEATASAQDKELRLVDVRQGPYLRRLSENSQKLRVSQLPSSRLLKLFQRA